MKLKFELREREYQLKEQREFWFCRLGDLQLQIVDSLLNRFLIFIFSIFLGELSSSIEMV